MAVKQIDCYGFETTSEFFKLKKLDAHLVKMKDGAMYSCFGDEPMRPIHRLDRDADGSLRVTWAYGAWDDAERLAYVPINETINVKEGES